MDDLYKGHIRYEFRGANEALLYDPTPTLRIEGPAGTGKTLAIIFKLHLVCELNPNVRVLVIRDTRTSLNETVVMPYLKFLGPGHPAWTSAQPSSIQALQYPNGSRIIFGGLDNPGRIMGTDYDIIWINEGTVNVKPEDLDMLSTRLRGPLNAPYRQRLIDMNPAQPSHWLNKWPEDQYNKRLYSKHQDNPILHDGETWTKDGASYRRTLAEAHSQHIIKRMLDGVWAAADGAIFGELDERVHDLKGHANYPEYFIGLDWGIADPFGSMLIGIDRRDKIVHVMAECYGANFETSVQCDMTSHLPTLSSKYRKVERCERDGVKVKRIYYDPRMDNRQARDAKTGEYGDPPIDDFRPLALPMTPGRGGPGTRLPNLELIQKLIRATVTGDGWRLYIDKQNCPKFWEELEGAQWHKKSDGTVLEDTNDPDHLITACYYVLATEVPRFEHTPADEFPSEFTASM